MMRNSFPKTHLMDLDEQPFSSENSQSSQSMCSSTHSPEYTTLQVLQQQPVYQIPPPHAGFLHSNAATFYDTMHTPPVIDRSDGMPHLSPSSTKPRLIIIEQPSDKFRFRYSSEMHGTHGSLMGENTRKNQKSYPQVKLEGYSGKAVIRCTLYQERLQTNPSPHSHSLVVRKNDRDECDPHYFEVDGAANMTTIKCQGMGIIHTAKKEIIETLRTKLEAIWQKEFNAEIGRSKRKEFMEKAESEAKNMNLNQVSCCCSLLILKILGNDHVYDKLFLVITS